ncbi:MAG: SIS domain-containing protein [Candidatus Thermoplasmatota archaeon]|nr:SIS domain-containing protein [Candidatus Thermoplasmatota archaeon]MBU4143422.1 SIS domain-containing protein [Candidatus Thermoplasmatota archaeon]MBU4592451.1 SIS domain-containing protein [Candidatus Thermoplasmatota archaeon]
MEEFRKNFIDGYLDDIIRVLKEIKANNSDFFDKLATIFLDARADNRKIFFCGNGGSASTASHFTSDLAKGTIVDGAPRFKALSLADNIPQMLAWGNDSCYEDIFVEQLKNLFEPGDVVVGISGSGNSGNVLRAIKYASENDGITVGITGFDGGKIKNMTDLCLIVPVHNMQKTEDIHMLVDHLTTLMIKEEELARRG